MATIKQKADHVRAAKQTAKHTCHWPGCSVQVPPAKWGCLKHWRMLPLNIQHMIWHTYRIGQEADKNPSKEYLKAARAAREWIAANVRD